MTTEYKTKGREYCKCPECEAIFPQELELKGLDKKTPVCPVCKKKGLKNIGNKVEEFYKNILV